MTTNALSMLARLVGSTPQPTVAVLGGLLVGLVCFSVIMLAFWVSQRQRRQPPPVVHVPSPAWSMPYGRGPSSAMETGPASAVVMPTMVMKAMSLSEAGQTLMGLGVYSEELAEELALRQALKKNLSSTQRLQVLRTNTPSS